MNIWMSSGGTSSSQHFDTQDNIFVQVEPTKCRRLPPTALAATVRLSEPAAP